MATSAEWHRVEAATDRPAYSVFTKAIEKSAQDDRAYRILQLDNGLQVTLVSDPKGDKAAASLDVAVGHLSDPDDMPGLAHFCEHLLFMGTEQFPRENEYSEYLAKNSGSSNAFTSVTNTNYYFNVGPPALAGALERFASFFHSPLFAPSCTSRELTAVDSEHKKNHQSDIWRIFQVNKHLSRDGHPWRKFGTGNRETLERAAREVQRKGALIAADSGLKGLSTPPSLAASRSASPALSETEADGGPVGRETRRRLVEWWSKEYCASRMRLCVVGKDSLDDLAKMVVPLFSPIINRGSEALPMFTQHPFGQDESGTLVSVQTIMDFHGVEVSFPLEWQPPYWRHSPANFMAHFTGHEGPGSLHSYLKNKGWITALSAGPQNLARGFAMFKVTLHLTNDGFKNHQAVILAVFKYLSLFRAAQFEAWQQSELCLLARTRFRFQEKSRPDNYATYISEHMAWPMPREFLLSGPQLVWEWGKDGKDEADVRRMLGGLRLGQGRAVLMGRPEEHERVSGQQEWQVEPIYGTKYRVERFDDEFLRSAEAPNDLKELFLPGPNEFIPTNLDVDKKEVAEPSKRPFLIRETPLSTVWHKKDDQFWIPKAHAIIQIVSPLANMSARQWVMTRLWVDLVTDSLTDFAYDAELAGLTYNLSSHNRGAFITVSGYNDKLPVLARHVFERLRSLQVQSDRLAVVKEKTKREWENFFLGQSYTISSYFTSYLVVEKQWTIMEKLEELAAITLEDIHRHADEYLTKVHLEMLINGNIRKEDALNFADMAETILGSKPIASSEVPERALLPAEGSNHVWTLPVPNPNEQNSALTYFVHAGDANDASLRVTMALLTQLLTEPAFNVLRTQEQLGYIVHCSQLVLARDTQTGLKLVVQSERAPAFLEERVEAFLGGMRTKIEEMPAEEFEAQKQGLARQWSEKVKNLREETNRFWKYFEAGHLDFLRRKNDAAMLETITKDDVLKLFMAKIHPSSPTRAKLSVHLRSQKPPPMMMSAAALAALQLRLREANVPTDGLSWIAELGGDAEPPAAAVVKYWTEKFANMSAVPHQTATALLAAIPALADEHRPESAYEGKLAEGAVVITDPKAFKRGLKVAPDPKPVVQWGDLPTPKL